MSVPPSLRSFDLNLLVLFDVLYKHRTITKAAQAIGITQPAASKALRRLRKAFDDPLFVRHGNKMDPTRRAKALAPTIVEALSSLERSFLTVHDFEPDLSDRVFRLGIGELGEVIGIPSLVGLILQKAPHACLQTVAETRLKLHDLALRGDIDIGFDFAPPPYPELKHRLLGEEEFVVIARRDHPRVRGTLSLKGFLAEGHVALQLDALTRRLADCFFGLDRHERRVIAQMGHYSSLPAVVIGSDAIAIVPRAIATASCYSRELQVISYPLPSPRVTIYAYWQEGLEQDPGHTWLRSFITHRFWLADTVAKVSKGSSQQPNN